jgi:uncharacterized protein (TIGR03067 family)
MKNTMTIVLCSLGILASGCSKSNPQNPGTQQKPDSAVLQGTWSGQEVGAKAQGSPSLTFSGATLEFHGGNPQEWYKGTFTLREDTNPKRLDAVVTDCPVPQYVGKTSHAIYKIEAGKFTLTGNEPGDPAVPASFDEKGARQIVFTLKQ